METLSTVRNTIQLSVLRQDIPAERQALRASTKDPQYRLNSEPKRESMISDTSEYSPYGTLSVLPSDTLVRANSNSNLTSESWMGGIDDIFAEQNHHVGDGQRSSWAADLDRRPDRSGPMELGTGTSDSPICVDESPSECF